MTGFRTYQEFVDKTSVYERHLLIESIEAWHEDQSGDGAGGGGLPGMAGGGL